MRYLTLLALCAFGAAPSHAEVNDDSRQYAVEGVIVPGNHTRLDTPHGVVHVWAPEGYRAETASLIVYVHGYFVNVDDAWWAHGLPEQFGASSINALFIAVEAPARASQGVSWCSIAELVATVDPHISETMPKGQEVIAIGHSGAYRTLEQWRTDATLDTIVMLDSGYGAHEQWVDWAKQPGHRLITVSSDTEWWFKKLHKDLPTHSIVGFPSRPESLQRVRLLHIKTTLDHWQVVTTALPATLRMLRVPRLVTPPDKLAATP